MRSFFKKTSTKSKLNSSSKIHRTRKRGLSYGALEERRVLATTAAFIPATGVLTVTLSDANDNAVVEVVNNFVTVNGSDQILINSVAGPLSANDVRQITISGNVGSSDQTVVLDGNFTDAAGRDLNNVFIQNVNQVSVLGDYEVDQNFTAFLDGTNGGIGDGLNDATGGSLVVAGTTTINASTNSIQLDNAANDFTLFSATTTGSVNNDISVTDINSIVLTGIESSGDLLVTAGGTVTDTATADINVGQDGRFIGTNIDLGSDTQTTNFRRVSFDASGSVALQEDTNITLVSTNAQSLQLTTPGALFDGTTTTVDVAGLAELNATFGVRFGDNGTDTFNAGSVTFVSNGHVSISERSGTNFVGNNEAGSLSVRSIGDITNGINATVDVTRQSGLTAQNVILGDQAGDNIQTGALYFFAVNQFEFQADSDVVLIERKNEAGSLDLRSTGTITDDDSSITNIRGLAQFTAASVDIGDTTFDEFNAGSVQFDTETTFRFREDSNTNLINASEAGLGFSLINSTGNISNSDDATVAIDGSISFFADNVILGNRNNDDFRFGVLSFNTSPDDNGLVDITEDDSTLIAGTNSATNLRIQSLGSITDGQNSSIDVLANSRFEALNNDEITIGDRGDIFAGGVDTGNDFDATFNSGSLTVQSAGDVFVESDSQIMLTGTNIANNLTLDAGQGMFNIVDSATAQINATGTLDVRGNLINLGTGVDANTGDESDMVVIGGLTFNSAGNTIVSTESSYELRGSSRAEGILILDSDGQITAATDATFASIGNFSIDDVDGIFPFVVSRV